MKKASILFLEEKKLPKWSQNLDSRFSSVWTQQSFVRLASELFDSVDRCSSDSWILLSRKSGHDRKIDIMQYQNISSILQESSKS